MLSFTLYYSNKGVFLLLFFVFFNKSLLWCQTCIFIIYDHWEIKEKISQKDHLINIMKFWNVGTYGKWERLLSKFKIQPSMALVGSNSDSKCYCSCRHWYQPWACVTHHRIQSMKTQSHHKSLNLAGWVTVWGDFIHYYRSRSENTNSQG